MHACINCESNIFHMLVFKSFHMNELTNINDLTSIKLLENYDRGNGY